jgi:hypothetical protein
MKELVVRARSGWCSRRNAALGATALAMAMAVPGVAQAEWYFTKAGAQRVAKDYVSDHYADTYASDLATACRPQWGGYDPGYKYHRWVCFWQDSHDDTAGAVLIVGSRERGSYYGRVLVGAH